MCAVNGGANIRLCQFSGLAPFVGLAARAQSAATQLDDLVRGAAAQGLCVGVGANEFHAAHCGVDHVLDGVAAAAAHTNHLDLGALVKSFFFK